MALTLVVLCLASLSSLVSAQCSGSTTVTTSNDADAISSCSTFDGDIIISSSASGDIYLNGIDTITGNLTAADATSLTSLNADKLTSIGGTLYLSSLPKLNAVAFPSLQQIHTLKCIGLPELQGLSFDTDLTKAEDIYISDTGLTSFAGTTIITIGSINFNNNAKLETVNLNSLVNSSSSLSFEANAPNLTVQITSLQVVYGNLTFQNISGWDIADLQNVTGSFTCNSCSLTDYAATWVQVIDGDLTFIGSDLQSFEFPALATIGGNFQLSNNSQLTDLSTFPWLSSVGGSLILHGVFDSVEFPSLTFVRGNIDIETTSSNSTICNDFSELYSAHDLEGGLSCQVSVSQSAASSIDHTDSGTNLSNTSDTSTSANGDSSGGSSGLGAGAIAGIVVGALVVLVGIALAIFLLRRRSKAKTHSPSELDTDGLVSQKHSEAPPKEGRAEMYVDPRNVAEMRAQEKFASELDSSDKANMSRAGAKEIPGVHEADDNTSSAPTHHKRTGTPQELFSPVSPLEGSESSRIGNSATATENTSEDRKTPRSIA